MQATYGGRGWCYEESAISNLVKPSAFNLDLGQFSGSLLSRTFHGVAAVQYITDASHGAGGFTATLHCDAVPAPSVPWGRPPTAPSPPAGGHSSNDTATDISAPPAPPAPVVNVAYDPLCSQPVTVMDQEYRAVRNGGGVCDGNNIAACGVPVVDTMGVRGGKIHSPEEFMIVPSLVERAALSALVLERLAAGDPLASAASVGEPA